MFLSRLLPRYLAYLVYWELLKTRKIAYEGYFFGLADLQAYFARIVPSCSLISASKNKDKMGSYKQLLALLLGTVGAYWSKLYK